MEPEIEVQDNNGVDTVSESSVSEELCFSKSQDASDYDETRSDAESSLDLDPLHEEIDKSESSQPLDGEDMPIENQSTKYNQSLSENHENYAFSQDTCHIKSGDDYHPPTSTSLPTLPSSKSPSFDLGLGRLSQRQSPDFFTFSLGYQVETNQTLTRTTTTLLTPSPPQGPKARPCSGIGARGNGSVESPDEGGSREEAPPAPVSFGIPGQAAEQAEKWDSDSDRDLCRTSRHRARRTRRSHNESQTEKQVKEAKSKCKRISLLLTNAPNPRNKGALLFKKRQQRVKKYTFVSYGTGQKEEIESEEEEPVAFNFLSPCDSELEDDYSLYSQDLGVPVLNLNLNRDNFFRHDRAPHKMEHLPETKGKGVMLFAQRRQRMEELTLEHEEMRRRGIPVEGVVDPKPAEQQDSHEMNELPDKLEEQHANHVYMEAHTKKHMLYEESNQLEMHATQVMDSMEEVMPKPLVPNRTAKPFSCFNTRAPAPPPSSVPAPVAKRPELKFKVPVPVNTNPQVWSPTGDIIASRDERISVPAIKTGIPPECKRRGSNKQQSMSNQASSSTYLQNKGERRSYFESGQEEDYLSLGAEACNFMQPRSMKLKNPPPVAPKPTINPSCPPWSKDGPPCDVFEDERSPIPKSSPVPAASTTKPSYQKQSNSTFLRQPLLDPQQLANPWAPSQEQLQPPVNSWAPANSPLQLQPSLNSWSPQPPQSPVSIHTPTSAAPHAPPTSRDVPAANSVASCPAKPISSNHQSPKAPLTSDRGSSTAADAPLMMGKGAKLFAKRQSRMEKFVVDADTVQANLARSPSPSSSLPNTWRYSPNVRAPPPVSYNPLLAPFYPPAAAKQPPSTSPKIKSKAKAKSKPTLPKHLDTLDVMKHQPYQLDSSLFKYEANTEASSSSHASPLPPSDASPAPTPSPIPAPSPRHAHNSHSANQQKKLVASAKPVASGLRRSYSLSLPRPFIPSYKPVFPSITPGFQPSLSLMESQTSLPDRSYKPPTPWEAAARSPLGLVDEAFNFQNFPQSIASNVASAAHRRSLPEPPAEWKRKVSLDTPGTGPHEGYYRPHSHPLPMSQTRSSLEKPVVYGPPFRPAQPLKPWSSASFGYTGVSMGHHIPTSYTPLVPSAMRSTPGLTRATFPQISNVSVLYYADPREEDARSRYLSRGPRGDANGDTMDLGKKLCTPKDIMLEELSLLSNRGSRLFKMRQRRSDKYTFESIQNETNTQLNNNSENTEETTEEVGKTPPNTPAPGNPPNPENIAPGYGGPLQDVPAEKFNSTAVPKSYHSPWEQAIINDPALAETLNLKMPAPEPRPEGPDYKSFNRVATPFGGFDKAPRGITFKLPDLDLNAPKYPELQDPGMKRPTFNRTALGWISDGSPIILPTVPLEPMVIPESDDL